MVKESSNKMTALRKNNHVHKYIRVKLNKYLAYKCALPNCAHLIAAPLVEGKMSVCWRCEEPFVINKIQSKMKRPHCTNCVKPKKKKEFKVEPTKRDRLLEHLEKRIRPIPLILPDEDNKEDDDEMENEE